MSSYPWSYHQLAHQHGFDSFEEWVRSAEAALAEEENARNQKENARNQKEDE